ncbi:MAG: peptidase E [Chloroflexi bacterium]|nr:peptidase E [Chloroflexota bacterium]
MRQVVALGGGGFSEEPDNPLLDDFILGLRESDCPSVCFVPTASGDADKYIAKFYASFAPPRARPSHVSLFHPKTLDDFPETAIDARDDIESHLLSQDVVYVGGGNTPAMLAVWRIHGIDRMLRTAWERGVVLCGISAGSLCWFESGLTGAFGQGLVPLHDGLGLLRGSHCPHYDSEPGRQPTYRKLVASGDLDEGWAADDGTALHFVDREFRAAVSSRPAARAFRVTREGQESQELPLPVRFLGDPSRHSPD